jgi:hypothetical protein
LFFASSLTLAYLGGRRPEAPKSVIDRVTVPQTQTQEPPPPAPTTQQQQAPADQPVEAPQAPANNAPNDAQTGQPPQQ